MNTMLLTFISLSSFLSFQPLASNQGLLDSEIFSFQVEYPDNQSKTFASEDEFYAKLDKKLYTEYENAAYSMRKKIFFHEVPDAELIFRTKTNLPGEKWNISSFPFIHPNRQVYFLASFQQNEKEEFHKYTIIDAETNTVLLGGNHYHLYDNPYK
ncbi:hypothetical protein [Psychrobacillus sp. NPDC093180]|uniref:hypothetical protein n=1 Tax=Psychrobacillus sp. NPDC093180 TaxID=3364489 RepID=UPI00382CF242